MDWKPFWKILEEAYRPDSADHFETLKERLLAMGGLAEERVRTAMQGLVERDGDLIDEVLNGDTPVNELHIDIDDLCLKLLALHSPMAADLRAVMAALSPRDAELAATARGLAEWHRTHGFCAACGAASAPSHATCSAGIRIRADRATPSQLSPSKYCTASKPGRPTYRHSE